MTRALADVPVLVQRRRTVYVCRSPLPAAACSQRGIVSLVFFFFIPVFLSCGRSVSRLLSPADQAIRCQSSRLTTTSARPYANSRMGSRQGDCGEKRPGDAPASLPGTAQSAESQEGVVGAIARERLVECPSPAEVEYGHSGSYKILLRRTAPVLAQGSSPSPRCAITDQRRRLDLSIGRKPRHLRLPTGGGAEHT